VTNGPTFVSSGHLPPAGRESLEFISLPEWCRRMGCSLDAGYRAARVDAIPGLYRIGRLLRINWSAFVAATSAGPGRPGP